MEGCEADERIEHLVVLMLENRSFDHMLGFESFGPSSPALTKTGHGNRNPCDPSTPVTPSNDATYLVPLDAPHSFDGVSGQINGGAMDGFVASFHEKASGHETKPILHTGRMYLLGALLIALLVLPGVLWPDFFRDEDRALILIGAGAGLFGLLFLWARPVLGPLYQQKAALYLGGAYATIVLVVAVSAQVVESIWFPLGVAIVLAILLVWGVTKVVSDVTSCEPLVDDPCAIGEFPMKCMNPSQNAPILYGLARTYGVCTRWFSSVPGETWPNRNFVHAGTSDGDVDIEIGFYRSKTVYDMLDKRHPGENNWHIYYDGGVPQVAVFRRLWKGDRAKNWRLFRDPDTGFRATVGEGTLPKYTFIEPKHYGKGTNSQHPGNNTEQANKDNGCLPGDVLYASCSDFARGEDYIAEIYQTLVDHPDVFERTLFVVTYDEHGGMFDRESPVVTEAPRPWRRAWTQVVRRWFVERTAYNFDFTESGVRVPAVVVSPWIRQGRVDDTVYDHVSVIATIRELFDLPAAREGVDRRSNALGHLVCEIDRPMPPEDREQYGIRSSDLDIYDVGKDPVHEPVEGFAEELQMLANLIVDELPHVDASSIRSQDPRLEGDPQAEFVAVFSENARAAREREGDSTSPAAR